ncbi:mandelate racemase/muconate lactonizing enzyme family protein [Chloroflexota bacterium]
MLIKKIELFVVTLPRRRGHSWATSITQVGEGYVILRITTDTGIVGYGEAAALPEWGGDFGRYSGEMHGTVLPVIAGYLFPVLKDESPFALEYLMAKMNRNIKGHFYAKAAIQMALLDIIGKATSQPAYNFLGGQVRHKVELAHSLGLMEIGTALEEAKIAVSEGIKNIKIRGGLDPKRDVELIGKLDTMFQGEVPLILDGNEAYRSVAEAIWVIERIGDCNIAYVEQPVAGIQNLARLHSQVTMPLMADESIWTHHDVLSLVEAKAVDYISIYVSKAGGPLEAKKVADLASAGGILCNVNGSAEFGVGNAANLQAVASSHVISLACAIPLTTIQGKEQTEVVGRNYQDDIIVEPFRYEDGYLIVPTKPGLGIEIDEDKLKYHSAKEPLIIE